MDRERSGSPVEKLQLRLAAGEISKVEYFDLLKILDGATNSRPSLGPILSQIDNVRLYETHICVDSHAIPLSEITDVSGDRSSYSVNFLPISKHSWIKISFANDEPIMLHETRTYLGGDRHKALSQFYSAVKDATWKNRANSKISDLRLHGKIMVGSYKDDIILLTNEGVIESETRSVCLKKAKAKGIFELGREGIYLGLSKSYDPNAALVCEEPGILRIIPSSAIRFEIMASDVDVIKVIIETLAKPNTRFARLDAGA